jgi:hypothetical protein
LFGNWQATGATVNGSPTTVSNALGLPSGATTQVLNLQNEAGLGATVTDINASGTVSSSNGNFSGVSGSGSLTVGGKVIPFTYQMISGGILQLTMTINGKTVVITWVESASVKGALDPAVEGAWKVTGVTVNGGAATAATFYGLSPATDQEVLQWIGDETGFSREINNNVEKPLAKRRALNWAAGAGAWAMQQGGTVLHGSYATTASLMLLTYLDPVTGNTVAVSSSRWPAVQAGGTLPAQFQGIWHCTGVTKDGAPQSQSSFFNWQPGTTSQQFQFYSDGTAEDRELAGSSLNFAGLGAWWIVGATMHMSTTKIGANVPYTYTGGTLTLKLKIPGTGNVVMTLQPGA